jgi:Fur family ferric uptake transcriptional regulator
MRNLDNKNKSEDMLKKEGLKKTQGRNAVLDILTATNKPLTYDEVFLALINKNISINVSTVYRILEMFANKGMVTKINGGENNRSFYELSRNGHRHYFFCVNCREMFPISNCPMGSLVEELKNIMQFEVFDHKLEVSGVCRDCKNH